MNRNNIRRGFIPLVALVLAGVAIATGFIIAFKIKQVSPPASTNVATSPPAPTASPISPVTLSVTNLVEGQSSDFSVSLELKGQKISGFQIYLNAKFTNTPPEITITPTAREFSYLLAKSTTDSQNKTVQIAIAAFSTNGISLDNPLEVAKIAVQRSAVTDIATDSKLTKVTSFETGETLPLTTNGQVLVH